MEKFILKEVKTDNIDIELERVGFDKSYISTASQKFRYKNIKIYSLTTAQANILKQTALSAGADCATHRETITGRIDKSDCILGGSVSQLKKIADNLSRQPFCLKILGEKITAMADMTKEKNVKIAGILNLTPDSFSDGGEYIDFNKAKEHLLYMVQSGADIIDIGAESTKPFSSPVSAEVQIERLLPILEFVKEQNFGIPVSVDTRSSKTAEECIKSGASIINDVSGFDFDDGMADVVSKYGVKVIIQHSKGTPENMQENPHYESLIDEIYLCFKEKIDYALSKGIKRENIIIDPGIGFGKTREDNFEIIKRVEEFYGLGCEVMLGLSRKSLLNMTDSDNEMKDIFTAALNTLAVERRVDYLRVHNAALHKTLLEVTDKI